MYEKLVRVVSTYDQLNISELKSTGLGLEIQDFTEPNLSFDEKEKIITYYKEKLKDFTGIRAMHGPFLDLRPASPDLDIRRLSISKYIETINIGSRLSMDYIIFHSQLPSHKMSEEVEDLIIKQNLESWSYILDEAKEFKGKILIENVFEKDPRFLGKLIRGLARDKFFINLDLGHVMLGPTSLDLWLDQLSDYIHYSHIHSNNGSVDQHLPVRVDKFKNYLKLLKNYSISPILSLEYEILDLESELKRLGI